MARLSSTSLTVLVLLGGCVRYGYQSQATDSAGTALDQGDQGPRTDHRPAPDQGLPDSFVVPDAGCPAGFIQCGQICADLTKDLKHCGDCATACPDGVADTCAGGQCRCGTGPPCTDGLSCDGGSCVCSPKSGLCPGCCDVSGKCIAKWAPCDDGNACTKEDTCTVACKGTPIDCSQLNQPCVVGTCDPQTSDCVAVKKNDGAPCEDYLYCTVGETCQAGICTSGSALKCDDQCNTGTCDEQLDKCVKTSKLDGTACNDGKECTVNDGCSGGVCTGTPKSTGTSCGSLGGQCCGSACCSLAETVCCPSTSKCCVTGSSCCGDSCCPPASTCCNNTHCCPAGTNCCGSTCCLPGYSCCPDSTCKLSCT